MISWSATLAIRLHADLGEGPWWDAPRRRLLWVDITAGRVHAHVPATGQSNTFELPDLVGFVVGARAGGYVAGTAAGLVRLDSELAPRGSLGVPPDLEGERRINDGACDPAGRVLFGTVDPDQKTTGTLWCRWPDGKLVAVLEGIAMSNGLAFSPDNRRLYYVDSPTQEVQSFAYDVRTGALSDRRVLVRVPETIGLPDGLAVDDEGYVWLALWGAGEVWRISPDGRSAGVVNVPAECPTSCAFGGARRERLYITTARAGAREHDGAVFAVDAGVTGAAPWGATVSASR
jgi:sugar lactone lactonase YvrE